MIGVAILWLLVGLVLGAAGACWLVANALARVEGLRLHMLRTLARAQFKKGPTTWDAPGHCGECDAPHCPVCGWAAPPLAFDLDAADPDEIAQGLDS